MQGCDRIKDEQLQDCSATLSSHTQTSLRPTPLALSSNEGTLPLRDGAEAASASEIAGRACSSQPGGAATARSPPQLPTSLLFVDIVTTGWLPCNSRKSLFAPKTRDQIYSLTDPQFPCGQHSSPLAKATAAFVMQSASSAYCDLRTACFGKN